MVDIAAACVGVGATSGGASYFDVRVVAIVSCHPGSLLLRLVPEKTMASAWLLLISKGSAVPAAAVCLSPEPCPHFGPLLLILALPELPPQKLTFCSGVLQGAECLSPAPGASL